MHLKADLDATVNATWEAVEGPNPMWSIKMMSRKMGKLKYFWRAGNHITFDKLYGFCTKATTHSERLPLSNTDLPWCAQETWPEVTQEILSKLWEGYMCYIKLPLVSINKPVEMNFLIDRMWHCDFWRDDVVTCVPVTWQSGMYFMVAVSYCPWHCVLGSHHLWPVPESWKKMETNVGRGIDTKWFQSRTTQLDAPFRKIISISSSCRTF